MTIGMLAGTSARLGEVRVALFAAGLEHVPVRNGSSAICDSLRTEYLDALALLIAHTRRYTTDRQIASYVPRNRAVADTSSVHFM